MKISIIQPEIKRGDISNNTKKIQQLINKSQGELLIFPEYVLTGSLVLDESADIYYWADLSKKTKKEFQIPDKKTVLLDILIEREGQIFNTCELLPGNECQEKVYPDAVEKGIGVVSGDKFKIFERYGKRFKIVICADFRYQDEMHREDTDFLVWITHFNANNYGRAVSEMKRFVLREGIPVLASSPVSDKDIGNSTYINIDSVVSLSSYEGILEIESNAR
jgi:predicted amidohydrolase